MQLLNEENKQQEKPFVLYVKAAATGSLLSPWEPQARVSHFLIANLREKPTKKQGSKKEIQVHVMGAVSFVFMAT